jgi:hypothetical protein
MNTCASAPGARDLAKNPRPGAAGTYAMMRRMDEVSLTRGNLTVTRKRGGRVELRRTTGQRLFTVAGVDALEADWLADALPVLTGKAKAKTVARVVGDPNTAVTGRLGIAEPVTGPAGTPALF